MWTNCLASNVPIFLQDEVLMQSVGCSPGPEPSLKLHQLVKSDSTAAVYPSPTTPTKVAGLRYCNIYSQTFFLHLPANRTNKCKVPDLTCKLFLLCFICDLISSADFYKSLIMYKSSIQQPRIRNQQLITLEM